uniref:Uncharacterized protein n=1 Tax=Brassica oleracea var. oleracea TaxID=109376 RepID=A0A0D3AV59_BRAOL
MSASSSFPPSLRRNLGLTRNRKDLIKSLAVVEWTLMKVFSERPVMYMAEMC